MGRPSDHFSLRLLALDDVDAHDWRLIFPAPDADVHARRVEAPMVEISWQATDCLVD